jgi:hypothetical protein
LLGGERVSGVHAGSQRVDVAALDDQVGEPGGGGRDAAVGERPEHVGRPAEVVGGEQVAVVGTAASPRWVSCGSSSWIVRMVAVSMASPQVQPSSVSCSVSRARVVALAVSG